MCYYCFMQFLNRQMANSPGVTSPLLSAGGCNNNRQVRQTDRQTANSPGVTSPLLSCLLEELDTDRMPGDAPSPSAGLKTELSTASLAHCWLTASLAHCRLTASLVHSWLIASLTHCWLTARSAVSLTVCLHHSLLGL